MGENGRLLGPVREACGLSEKVRLREDRHRHDARRSLDHHPAPATLDEKDGVARFALINDGLAWRERDAPEAASERPQGALRKAKESWGLLEQCDPGEHDVVGGPAAVSVLARGGESLASLLAGQHGWGIVWSDDTGAGSRYPSPHPFVNPQRPSTAVGPMTGGKAVGRHDGSGLESELVA